MVEMATDEQIKYAMDMIVKKNCDISTLMYDMQNFSTIDHDNADLRNWLAGMTIYGYKVLIERLERM
jgi:hypothetical protein